MISGAAYHHTKTDGEFAARLHSRRSDNHAMLQDHRHLQESAAGQSGVKGDRARYFLGRFAPADFFATARPAVDFAAAFGTFFPLVAALRCPAANGAETVES